MAKFVQCSIPSVEYLRGEKLNNKAVNIDNVVVIEKGKVNWYPDNEGLPMIKFVFVSGGSTEWTFRNATARDQDYQEIMNKFGVKNGTQEKN